MNNSPLMYTDPSGHQAWDGCSGENGGCAGGSNYKDYVYNYLHTDQERQENQEDLEKAVDTVTTVIGVVNEPADWMMTAAYCASGECSPWVLVGLLPFVPSSVGRKADNIVDIVKGLDGAKLPVDDALDLATEFLGKDYVDMGNGRFISADNLRQVRMSLDDILGKHGGGPHINFELLSPNKAKPGFFTRIFDPIHIFLHER